jgi:dTDP-4-amino-4,6-dideoxygalactose transaminase
LKERLEDLAIFGGRPAFAETLHVGRPNVGDRAALVARIEDLLERRWLTNNGPFVQEFERRVAGFVGVRHCVATCNATVALEILARALGLSGEVIVPAFTFVATAHALRWLGLTPVFCDIDPATHTIDPREIERLVTPRTSAVVGVHVWGQSCDAGALEEICRRRGLRLVFDAAHAFGNARAGRMIGGFGDAEVFSFHATKFFNTFEGGAVTTNDEGLAAELRLMQNFGFAGFDRVERLGTNGKMSEVSAAMGLTSFESLDEFVAANRRNYEQYRRETEGLAGLRLMPCGDGGRNNYQYVVFEIDAARAGVRRDDLIKVFWAENVVARRYFYPGCHRMEPYRSDPPRAGQSLAATEEVCERVLLLPTGTAVGENEVREICRILRLALSRAPELTARLAGTMNAGR